MKGNIYKLLFYTYSTGFVFCKKKNKTKDNKKDIKEVKNNSEIKTKEENSNNNEINSKQIYSIKSIVTRYPEITNEFLDELIASNCQRSEDSIVNLICRCKENINTPENNASDNSKKDSKSKSKKNSKKDDKKKSNDVEKDQISIKKITKYDNIYCQGYLISGDGYIIADYSLLKDLDNISVIDPKDFNKEVKATLVGYDEYLSLVLLKTDIKSDKFLEFNEYDKTKKFKYIQRISKGNYKTDGYTEVEFTNSNNTDKKNKNTQNNTNKKTFNSYSNVRSDVKTSALINIDGYMVGMNVYGGKFVNNCMNEYCSILPYNFIKKAVDDFKSKKYYVHDYKIFGLVSINNRIQSIKHLKLNEGCVVETVCERLKKCGLKEYDIIIEFNGNTIKDIRDFDYYFKYYNSEDITLKVNREGKEVIITLKNGLCGNIKYEYINNGITLNGATIVNIDKVSMDLFNRSSNFKGGVLISNVDSNSEWKCNNNFVITKIKDIPVSKVEDVVNIMKMLNKNYSSINNFDGNSLLIEGFYTKDINNRKCFGILIK